MNSIDNNFYCSAHNLSLDYCIGGKGKCDVSGRCESRHRKWPTPEQFKEEYGEEYPDDGAVYAMVNNEWYAMDAEDAEKCFVDKIVCACTPWGKPNRDWRPE